MKGIYDEKLEQNMNSNEEKKKILMYLKKEISLFILGHARKTK